MTPLVRVAECAGDDLVNLEDFVIRGVDRGICPSRRAVEPNLCRFQRSR